LKLDFSAPNLQNYIAARIQFDLAGTSNFKLDSSRIGSWLQLKVVFHLPVISVVHEINSGIYVPVTDLAIRRHIRAPLRWVTSEEVVYFPELRIFAEDDGILSCAH
jgi:hypothetical protein